MPPPHVRDRAPEYALGALTGDERIQVEMHAATCAECAEAIRDAEQTAALLPYAVTPYRAPAELRQLVLDHAAAAPTAVAVASTDAIPPETGEWGAAPTPEIGRPPILAPWLADVLLRILPWSLAIIGWIVVAALALFSHGQADRINTTQQDDQAAIASLTAQRDQAEVIQQYLLTPGVAIVPLMYRAGVAPRTNVVLFEIPGYIHAVVGARGLAAPPRHMTYAVWVRKRNGPYVLIGTLNTAGPQAQGVSVVVAPLAIDQYAEAGISLEYLPVPKQPSKPPIFAAPI